MFRIEVKKYKKSLIWGNIKATIQEAVEFCNTKGLGNYFRFHFTFTSGSELAAPSTSNEMKLLHDYCKSES